MQKKAGMQLFVVAFVAAILSFNPSSFAGALSRCFTPGEDCVSFIVHKIETAKVSIKVQAYGFTEPRILQAIGKAKSEKKLDVEVILDKTNEQKRYTGATYIVNHGIKPLIDSTVKIAHNKVIIIDGVSVVTGSFNFTRSAQQSNAENVLFVENDEANAKAYLENFERRKRVSRPFNDQRPKTK